MAGNITRSLTKDILKKISSEVKKSARLHNDIMLELMLTQKVINASSLHASSKGYLHHLQIDPFAIHLQTDTGTKILAEHLKQPSPISLYLDATELIFLITVYQREYLRMRRTRYGKTDWVEVKWRVMSHTLQQDGSSCGIIVVKMAEALIKAFPLIREIHFETTRKDMTRGRRDLALKILQASVFDEQSCCAMCAAVKPPGSGPPVTD
ncbi:hypothetical protein JOB18_047736 [Solea senegalensis]|uniref:Ubiquitin-like protease family profile domain-containing protein n=1 Tax=Solea senegalensis TaxID=28829 RepID=A0AAV6SNM9_SOLSE|nr:hypothetical protein JOB18_047736 [Solea senegalensis]